MEELLISNHAWRRISGRRIRRAGIMATIRYGRRYWNQGRVVYRLDRRCVRKAQDEGVSLQDHEGIHVVLGDDGKVVTAYRNRQGKRLPR